MESPQNQQLLPKMVTELHRLTADCWPTKVRVRIREKVSAADVPHPRALSLSSDQLLIRGKLQLGKRQQTATRIRHQANRATNLKAEHRAQFVETSDSAVGKLASENSHAPQQNSPANAARSMQNNAGTCSSATESEINIKTEPKNYEHKPKAKSSKTSPAPKTKL